jgi:sigma-B regulation protein RsbU (phosphoserine phosphatase)
MVYNNTPCYFFSFSNEGFITKINATMLDHLGYAHEEVIGKMKLEQLLTVGSRIFFQTHFYPLIKMQGKANEIFLSFLSKDKSELPVLLNVALHHAGETFEIHCGGMQIIQRNRFEKEILEAKKIAENALLDNALLTTMRATLQQHQELLEKQLQDLTTISEQHQEINKILSHDLQEPLRKISLFSNKLLHDYEMSEDLAAFKAASAIALTKIDGFVGRIRSLLDSLQRYNSLDDRQLSYSPINLGEIVEQVGKITAVSSFGGTVKIAESLSIFEADKRSLIDLFAELVQNSIQFSDPERPLLISIDAIEIMQNIFIKLQGKYRYEPCVKITYTDNGVGFNSSNDIFGIFRKAHFTKDGMGIGLAYCRKIVLRHHGLISADSIEGEGSIFTIVLPLAQASGTAS